MFWFCGPRTFLSCLWCAVAARCFFLFLFLSFFFRACVLARADLPSTFPSPVLQHPLPPPLLLLLLLCLGRRKHNTKQMPARTKRPPAGPPARRPARAQLFGARVVIGSSDGGPDGEEAPAGLADEIVSALPASTEYLVWVDSPESRKAARLAKLEIGVLGSLLGGGFKVRREERGWRGSGGRRCVFC